MKITFVFPPDTLSGGIKVALIHARALAQKGHDVRIVSPPPPRLSGVQRLRRFIKGEGWPPDARLADLPLQGSGISHHVLDRYRPVVDSDVADGDVVVATWFETAHWVSALAPSKGAKVHFIQHHEIFDYLPLDRCRATYRLPLHKIVIARWLKDTMATEYGDRTVDLVSNSVDRAQFFAPPRGKQEQPTIGLLYSSVPFKGVDVALEAARLVATRVPGLRIVAFGSEQLAPHLELPPGSDFHYRPAQDRIRDIYARCDVWVTASQSEGFNLPAMEAMACRTPVVSTRTGWPEEAIVSEENGLLVDIDDRQALATALEWILTRDEMTWRRLSENAFLTASRGSWNQSADLFEQALGHACRRAARGEIAGISRSLLPA
ncbi:MAG: glycosyltransferase family 4 protein [Bradyrhizobium sp.]|nr:glycosyltransferase family 4 protein [Bradyrhizobium sp.]